MSEPTYPMVEEVHVKTLGDPDVKVNLMFAEDKWISMELSKLETLYESMTLFLIERAK